MTHSNLGRLCSMQTPVKFQDSPLLVLAKFAENHVTNSGRNARIHNGLSALFIQESVIYAWETFASDVIEWFIEAKKWEQNPPSVYDLLHMVMFSREISILMKLLQIFNTFSAGTLFPKTEPDMLEAFGFTIGISWKSRNAHRQTERSYVDESR